MNIQQNSFNWEKICNNAFLEYCDWNILRLNICIKRLLRENGWLYEKSMWPFCIKFPNLHM
jgi:hypothetical protein